MSSLHAPPKAISGRQAIGPTTTIPLITTGCRVRGCWRRSPVSSGLQPIGLGAVTDFFSMKAIGARSVGFYGGINYGYGYFGHGYEGGRWDHDRFFYNRSVNNVNVTNIHNVYNTTIVNNTTVVNRVSYNGGNGGINIRPTREEETADRERHIPPVAAQVQHVRAAQGDREFRASVNHGRPAVAASARPGEFQGRRSRTRKGGGSAFQQCPQARKCRPPQRTYHP